MNGLEPFRQRLDEIDAKIAQLFGERFQICREVAEFKSQHDIPMMQPGRVVQVRARYLARGADADLPDYFTSALFELVIASTCRMEDELMETPESERVSAPGRISAIGDIRTSGSRRIGSRRRLNDAATVKAGAS
jgi:4-amino-4-deoxychorismate mutase